LEDAQREKLLELATDKRSGTYVVTRFGSELNGESPPPLAPKRKSSRRRRATGRKRIGPDIATPPTAAGDAEPRESASRADNS
jgi:hypothetical protein